MSSFRCQGCRQYRPAPPYRRLGLGGVCSLECLHAVARPKKPSYDKHVSSRPSKNKPDIPATVRSVVMRRDNFRCRFCGRRSGLHLHHITYRSEGVDHSEHNLIVLCAHHHALVHSSKMTWQPLLRSYIWRAYVEGHRSWLLELQRELSPRADGVPPRSHQPPAPTAPPA